MGGARRAVAASFVASAMSIASLTAGASAAVDTLPPPEGVGSAGGDATEPTGPGGIGAAGTTHDLSSAPPTRRPEDGPTNSALSRAAQRRAGDTEVVEVHHDGDRAAAEAAIVASGGRIHGPAGDHAVEATVPLAEVARIESAPHVTHVTTPTLASPAPFDAALALARAGPDHRATDGEEVRATLADAWHAAGITGEGVKVGIIDTFDAQTWWDSTVAGDLKGPSGTFCRWAGVNCDVWSGRSAHGVAVAEVVHAMAPGAQLYLADAYTTADFQAAIDYFHSQGVRVVTRSQTAEYDGPGDGTGGLADVIDDAIGKGMVYLNSVGNSGGSEARRGSYWRGPWVDTDNDGWLEFAPGKEMLSTICWYFNGLRWNDWGPNRTDYDVVLYDLTTTPPTPLGESVDNQRAGAPPIERFNNIRCRVGREVGIAVYRYHAGNGTHDDVLELMVNGAGLELWSNPHAAAAPMADSANPGMLAVGAIDPPGGTAIASYSSHGPTNDGRTKPDLVAPACLTSRAYAPSCFNGTSASTPVAAGAAALALSAGVASTPAGVAAYLRNATVDRGAPGIDDVYGRGALRLPTGEPAPFPNLVHLIDRQFRDFVGRRPTLAEHFEWNRRLLIGTHTRSDLVAWLRQSHENRTNVDPVARLYRAYFLRIPDQPGLQYWIGRKRAGMSTARISALFASSPEFAARYGRLGDRRFVEVLYRNVFDRPGDPAGVAFWTDQLARGRRDRGQVMISFSQSAEHIARETRAVNVSVILAQMLRRTPTPSEVTVLTSGAGSSTVVAEYAFARPEYSAT